MFDTSGSGRAWHCMTQGPPRAQPCRPAPRLLGTGQSATSDLTANRVSHYLLELGGAGGGGAGAGAGASLVTLVAVEIQKDQGPTPIGHHGKLGLLAVTDVLMMSFCLSAAACPPPLACLPACLKTPRLQIAPPKFKSSCHTCVRPKFSNLTLLSFPHNPILPSQPTVANLIKKKKKAPVAVLRYTSCQHGCY